MPRYFVTLSYNGKNYVGWQIQPNGMSVQETIQNAMSTILRQRIEIVGAGRTDAGVHARKMIAHFDFDGSFNPSEFAFKLNSFLPKDIAIHDICMVKPDAHARFSAVARIYSYHINTNKNPFITDLSYRIFYEPNIELMNRLGEVLTEYDDFTSFSKKHTDVFTNICEVEYAVWKQFGDQYVFTIKANRFLRNMVRSIVGTLLEAGRNRLDEKGFRDIIEAKNRQMAGDSAPAQGLFLEDVIYPDDIFCI